MRIMFTELQMSVPICLMVMASFQRWFFCFTCCRKLWPEQLVIES